MVRCLLTGGAAFALLVMVVISSISPISGGREVGDQQLLVGELEANEYEYWSVSGLEEGDELFIFMRGISGNLDPFVAMANASLERGALGEAYLSAVTDALIEGRDPLLAIPEVADRFFLDWDDDGGAGYSSALSFLVPEDGDYLLFTGAFPFTETFGGYELLLGLGVPGILEGEIQPSGEAIAIFDDNAFLFERESRPVQLTRGELEEGEAMETFLLRDMDAGDTLFVRLEVTSGDLVPFLTLYDYGDKPISVGVEGEGAWTMEHAFTNDAPNHRLTVEALPSAEGVTSGEFNITLGIDAPEVLKGEAEGRGDPIIRSPIQVRVGLELEQITEVDQRGERFSIVADLWMEWTDPDLAFSPDTCQCDLRTYRDIEDFVDENGGGWPEFTISNQQERRWTQNQAIVLDTEGHVTYLERFWTTLQAPDMEFSDFPFDDQSLFVRIDCLFPANRYAYLPWEERTEVGTQLGEEEWRVTAFSTAVNEVEVLDNSTSYVFRIEVSRNINFYVVRILIPLLVITAITWLTFMLRKYELRGTIATGNLLLFIAFNFTIGSDLPRLGYLTLLDSLLLSTFLTTAGVVVYNLYLLRLSERRREEMAKDVDRWMILGFPIAYILLFYLILEV